MMNEQVLRQGKWMGNHPCLKQIENTPHVTAGCQASFLVLPRQGKNTAFAAAKRLGPSAIEQTQLDAFRVGKDFRAAP